MRSVIPCMVFLLPWLASGLVIVEDGETQAEIVIAADAVPTVRLAARELQTFVRQMSGAELLVRTARGDAKVAIYLGTSERLNGADIPDGGFRLASGEDWLAICGRDTRFQPQEPWLHGVFSTDQEAFWKAWDAKTGSIWFFPFTQWWKNYSPELGIWEQDEFGTLNGVHEVLRRLGVRWYMPGKLGTIVPERRTIDLQLEDQVVRPAYPFRRPYLTYQTFRHASQEEVLWQLRQGFSRAIDTMGLADPAHGINDVLGREEMKREHPEYYALIDGKRQTEDGPGVPCLFSPGLLAEHAKYVRFLFDVYDQPMVSVMPCDGFTRMCECSLCSGKATPERGRYGVFSDYVWEYVERLAEELYKTHPDRRINCLAYSTYQQPPTRIKTFGPNVVVGIAQTRMRYTQDPEWEQVYRQLWSEWKAKLPGDERRMFVYDYYRYAFPNKGYAHFPAFFPRATARDLAALQPVSLGDYIEVYRPKPVERELDASMGITHLDVYVTGRCWWKPDTDIDSLLNEYVTLFYGPAAAEAKAFIDYSEQHWMAMPHDSALMGEGLRLLDAALAKAPPDSPVHKRLELIAAYMEPLRMLHDQLSVQRLSTKEIEGRRREAGQFVFDGKLGKDEWTRLRHHKLVDLVTGERPARATWFRVMQVGDSLCLGIHCDEPETPVSQADVLSGDCLRVMLETQVHGVYEVAINPAGKLLDWNSSEPQWVSHAEARTYQGDGFWSAEIRLPMMGEAQLEIDPKDGIAGRRPTRVFPWYMNVIRQRHHDADHEVSSYTTVGDVPLRDPRTLTKTTIR